MADDVLRLPRRVRRGAHDGEDESIKSAVWLVEHMCDSIGLDDLGDTELLDFGCGVKFTQALLAHSLPIKRYVGVDVYREMIEFLRESVDDPRFEYLHYNAHNALYNPDGEPLSKDTELPLDGRTFSLICLVSVFTHLAPHDYATLLRLLRCHVEPDGRLFFTLFIDELTEGGHGLMDSWAKKVEWPDGLEALPGRPTEPFRDLDPNQPLKWAVYTEEYARELIAGTGWRVVSLSPPDRYIQHHFVCAPC